MGYQLEGTSPLRVIGRWFARLAVSTWSETGGSLLETALLVPMLTLLFLAVIDVGRLAYMSIEVSNAARAGASYGAQSHLTAVNSTGIGQAAKNDASDLTGLTATATHYCQCSNGTSQVTCSLSSCTSARLLVYVQVSTSATFTPWFPFKGSPGSWSLSGLSTMRAEN